MARVPRAGGEQCADIGWAVLTVAIHDQHRVACIVFYNRAKAHCYRPLMAEIGGQADDLDRYDTRPNRQHDVGGVKPRDGTVVYRVGTKHDRRAGERIGDVGQ